MTKEELTRLDQAYSILRDQETFKNTRDSLVRLSRKAHINLHDVSSILDEKLRRHQFGLYYRFEEVAHTAIDECVKVIDAEIEKLESEFKAL